MSKPLKQLNAQDSRQRQQEIWRSLEQTDCANRSRELRAELAALESQETLRSLGGKTT